MSVALAAGLVGAYGAYRGSRMASKSAMQQAELDRQLQKEFAQHGVRWRVEDAKAAGIHPLAALGMSPNQATPVHVGAHRPRS